MTTFEDVEPLADRLRRGFLVTRRTDGSPTVHPLTPIYAEGGLYINTYRKSAKVKNLLRQPEMAYVVMTKGEEEPLRAFEARGTARVLEVSEVPDSFLSVGMAGEIISQQNLDRVRARLASGKRVYLRVEAEEWTECEPVAPAEAVSETTEPPGAGPEAWAATAAGGRIAMTVQELDAFLGRSGLAVLGTVDKEGKPRGRPVRYVNGRGRLELLMANASPSLGDLGGTPESCATVEEFPTYDEIRGVMAHGRTQATGGPAPSGWTRLLLEPERVLSFDFSKIPQAH